MPQPALRSVEPDGTAPSDNGAVPAIGYIRNSNGLSLLRIEAASRDATGPPGGIAHRRPSHSSLSGVGVGDSVTGSACGRYGDQHRPRRLGRGYGRDLRSGVDGERDRRRRSGTRAHHIPWRPRLLCSPLRGREPRRHSPLRVGSVTESSTPMSEWYCVRGLSPDSVDGPSGLRLYVECCRSRSVRWRRSRPTSPPTWITVDVDHLDQIVARLSALAGFISDHLDDIDDMVAGLTGTGWESVAAQAYSEAHTKLATAARAEAEERPSAIGLQRIAFGTCTVATGSVSWCAWPCSAVPADVSGRWTARISRTRFEHAAADW